MDACLAVEREVDKVVSKFTSLNKSINKNIDDQIELIGMEVLSKYLNNIKSTYFFSIETN